MDSYHLVLNFIQMVYQNLYTHFNIFYHTHTHTHTHTNNNSTLIATSAVFTSYSGAPVTLLMLIWINLKKCFPVIASRGLTWKISKIVQTRKQILYIKCWSPNGIIFSFRKDSRAKDLNSKRWRKNERMYDHFEFVAVGITTRSLTQICVI
jgi:hypothetical protein